MFEKDAKREIRRFNEHKERVAKRFHQLTNQVERNDENVVVLAKDVRETQENVHNFTEGFNQQLTDQTNHIDLISDLNLQLSIRVDNNTACCSKVQQSTVKLRQSMDEFSQSKATTEYSSKNHKEYMANNKKPRVNFQIVEFGSGDYHEDVFTNQDIKSSELDTGDFGSGETILEGSGVKESELPPFRNVDFSSFVEKTEFERENAVLKEMLEVYMTQNQNLSSQVSTMETRIANIQIGNFMQSLQESFINFTQNVITLDQWQMSSMQIVNSTLHNQDQINKVTRMVINSSDKMADLEWKVSNNELLSNQQYNILRMYVTRLNNSVEDIKEHIGRIEKRQSRVPQSGSPYGSMYGYQSGFRTGNHPDGNRQNETDLPEDRFQLLMSRLDELGLQVVFNQNRLGNLEVKMLNESLQACTKYNMDTYQDSQLASHEAIIKSNTNSILLTHSFMKELDNAVHALNSEIKSHSTKIRKVYTNLRSLLNIIPAVKTIKKEVDHFMLQLPIGKYFVTSLIRPLWKYLIVGWSY